MSEKIKVFPVTVFVDKSKKLPPTHPAYPHNQMEVLMPFDAISYFTPIEKGNPRTDYRVGIKKEYLDNFSILVENINTPIFKAEQLEVLRNS